MKTITINVSEPIYQDFLAYAKHQDRPASELIREAMATYHASRIKPRRSLRDRRPVSVGKILVDLSKPVDILGEMLDDSRD